MEWKPGALTPKRTDTHYLGNFLSGMETFLPRGSPPSPFPLGNFLSGMETRVRKRYVGGLRDPLETSLVEWKHQALDLLSMLSNPLETSLVEWKPKRELAGKKVWLHLGNFLSGMETFHLNGSL